jgi:2-polyprenyl-3-methyl-5-hydroxy-6-metoxy-1,4-benzoquinol methylase
MVDVACDEIDEWINILRLEIGKLKPELLALFDTYAGEAKFGRNLIDIDLSKLPKKACLLEVGAGSLILSCQLVKEGYFVTALEPIGEGFTHFEELRSAILNQAKLFGYEPRLLDIRAEELSELSQYDFAFSINVMEHVKDVGMVIERVMDALSPAGFYRFTCPNYLFPYEPHFDIPILFSKRFTEFVFKSRIYNNRNLPDPRGTWQSLNWITVPEILGIVHKNTLVNVNFRRDLFASMILRSVNDPIFSERRSPWLRKFLSMLVSIGLYKAVSLIPAIFQPIIDCTLVQSRNRLQDT